MKKVLVFSWLAVASVFHSNQACLQANTIPFATDYACFRSDSSDSGCKLEIYYSVSSDQLELSSLDSSADETGKRYGMVLANLDLFTEAGKAVDSLSKTTAFRAARADTSYQLSEILSLTVAPGRYYARLEIVDLKSGRVGRDTLFITAENFSSPGLQLSSLELARVIIEKPSGNLSFYKKNNRQVIPNPAGAYGKEDPRLYFYLEVYGLTPPETNLKNFELGYAVLGGEGETLKTSGFRKYPKAEAPSLAGVVDLSALPAGELTFLLTAREPATGQTASRSKPFLLFGSPPEPPAAGDEPKLFPKAVHYLLTAEEKKIFQSSNETGKLNFIRAYWQKNDPSPDTPKNEFKEQAYGRYHYAVDFYSRTPTSKDGWNTDRGRVHILYGPPSNLASAPASAANFPWEKWEYNRIAGGRQAYFIFADLRGLGNYQLVHSTAPGEKQNPAWEELVNQNILRR